LVTISPQLNQIFTGDLIYLTCSNSLSGSEVKWYLNGNQRAIHVNKTLKIPVADPVDSGRYRCESDRKESKEVDIKVKENIPMATLKIKTGQPVMRPGESVVLQLDHDDGLQGWMCHVYRGHETKRIALRTRDNPKSLTFQPRDLKVEETIFWCTDSTRQHRSNQITVRTSVKDISLEMYPQPAVAGEDLILKCYVWGTDRIRSVVFYKKETSDWKVVLEGANPTYNIPHVTVAAEGQYKCNAIYTHVARTYGPPYNVTSDIQELFVQARNVKAVVSENFGMLSCSCPRCPSDVSYRWYSKKTDNQPWRWMEHNSAHMIAKESATYACSAVWNSGRSFLSNGYYYQPPIKVIMIVLFILLMLLCLAAVAGCILWKRRRNTSGPIYEDVALRQRDKGDDKYEPLQKKTRGDQKEGEYDMLNPERPGRERKEGEYEALKKEGMKEGEYDTLGMQGAAGGGTEYEALKKEGMKGGEYDTLGMQGAAGGGTEYEALKKEGMKGGEYDTLGIQGAAGGGTEYEALKKEGMKEGVYHTLGTEEV
ncbi:hypothetical protein GBF38_011707, partial [Nibea albiflora]